MAKAAVFTESAARRLVNATKLLERTGSNFSNDQRRRRGLLGTGSIADLRIRPGTITAVGGPVGFPRYDAVAVGNTAVTVIDGHPIGRPFGTDLEVIPGSIGNDCILFKDADEIWRIWAVAGEILDTASCLEAPSSLDAVVTVTDDYEIGLLEELVLVDASAKAITITVPKSAENEGRLLATKKIDGSANQVTVATQGTDTIDQAASAVIAAQYTAIQYQADGDLGWWIR